MSAKINLTNNKFGQYLYKYLPFNQYSLQILINEMLWLGRPDLLNDPFEGDFIINNYKDLHNRKVIEIIFKKDETINSKWKDSVYSSLCNYLEGSEIDFLNTLNEFVSYKIRNTYGSTSFSKKCHILRMWSNYADSHKGFVLIFDKEKLESSIIDHKTRLYDVQYGSLSKIDLCCTSDTILINDEYNLLTRKLKEWNSEHEVRIIKRKEYKYEDERFLKFNIDCISGVIYGQRMLSENIFTISNILSYKKKEIKLYTAEKNHKRDKIIFKEIPNRLSNK